MPISCRQSIVKQNQTSSIFRSPSRDEKKILHFGIFLTFKEENSIFHLHVSINSGGERRKTLSMYDRM